MIQPLTEFRDTPRYLAISTLLTFETRSAFRIRSAKSQPSGLSGGVIKIDVEGGMSADVVYFAGTVFPGEVLVSWAEAVARVSSIVTGIAITLVVGLNVALRIREFVNRVRQIASNLGLVKHEVKNNHDTNLREEADVRHAEDAFWGITLPAQIDLWSGQYNAAMNVASGAGK
ncbi:MULTISPECIES: hypothetical protein [unclassified Curtobacterium]|uniref:hypothetical protein n=1 Tax=unclassified Curtobacterium TaxID=257496 RepID=UPI003A803603